MPFIERTSIAGDYITTPTTGENNMNETVVIPDPKSNLIIAEMCFPKDQLMMMLNDVCVTKDEVEDIREKGI